VNVLLFAVIGFGPLLLLGGVLLAGVLLNLWIMIAEAAVPFARDIVMFVLSAVGIPGVMMIAIGAGFWAFRRTRKWLPGSMVLFAVWFLLAFGMSLLVASALAGTSMAVVDGVADSETVRRGSLEMAGVLLLFAQAGIVPWVLGAGWLLGRLGVRSESAH